MTLFHTVYLQDSRVRDERFLANWRFADVGFEPMKLYQHVDVGLVRVRQAGWGQNSAVAKTYVLCKTNFGIFFDRLTI